MSGQEESIIRHETGTLQPQHGVREKNLMIEGRKSCSTARNLFIIKKTIGYVRNVN